ncbi:carbohydrate ABC transporter permease [Bacillus canaveralius]|uniref:carbohydrate ABC transporter permease n=1 Tax=Bacillus canaveralius TaxID=1403243 RepID=UPI000F789BE2|nr:sugar ABC transporter permease [Bacillus canaveralius]RSK55320.1 sugar ABC transporter permease [Bacillus canaveralius]
MLPALILLLLFWFIPMAVSLFISFTDWDYISPTFSFVGLENYSSLFTDKEFYNVLLNTLSFVVFTVVPIMAIGLGLALALNKKVAGSTVYKAILFSPWVTPMVAVSIVWSWIFQPEVGLLNFLLSALGLPKIDWLGSSTWAMPAVIIVTVWKGIGWVMIFYLEALQRVPVDLYESASIDGAPRWRRFRHITLPMISPTTFFLLIVTTIDALQAYDQIQVLTQGGPAGSTRTLLYMYYQLAFEQFNMGQATAVATLLVLMTALLSAIQFLTSKRWVHY